MKECFQNLVGLSRTDCDCFAGLDENNKDSDYNLFVDELEGVDLTLIQNALSCGEELDNNFETLYENAVSFYEADLQQAIAEKHKQRYKPYVGKFGETKYSATIVPNAVAGLKLDTKHVDGASIVINSIKLFFASSGSLILKVYKNDIQEGSDIPITIDSGETLHEFSTPIVLPIVENGIKNEYFFIYATAGLTPYKNKTSCGCAGAENQRKNFLTLRGVTGVDLEHVVTDQYAYGLSLNGTVSCSIDNLVCSFLDDATFKRLTAQSIWWKLGVLTIEKLFASREINFDTFTDREYLLGRKNKFAKNYRNIISWLSENTDIKDSLCFICNPANTRKMGKILT